MNSLATVMLNLATSTGSAATVAPAAAGQTGGASLVSLLEMYRSIRPGEADPELDQLLSRLIAGQATLQDTFAVLGPRLKSGATPVVGSNNAAPQEVLVYCNHCDRYSFMNTGLEVGKLR